MVRKKQSSTPSSTTSDLSDDPDTEEALKGFDFLASPDELDGSPGSRSGEDSGEWGETWFQLLQCDDSLLFFISDSKRRGFGLKQLEDVTLCTID